RCRQSGRFSASILTDSLYPSGQTNQSPLESDACRSLKNAGIVDYGASNDSKNGSDFLQGFVRHREVIVAEDHEVRQSARLDGSDLIFFPNKPTVAGRV